MDKLLTLQLRCHSQPNRHPLLLVGQMQILWTSFLRYFQCDYFLAIIFEFFLVELLKLYWNRAFLTWVQVQLALAVLTFYVIVHRSLSLSLSLTPCVFPLLCKHTCIFLCMWQMTDSYLSKLVWTVVFSNSIAVSSFASYGAGKSSIIAGSFSSIWYMFLQRNILLTIIILQPMLQELGKQNPQLVRLIQEHQADFLRLINEPVQGGEG